MLQRTRLEAPSEPTVAKSSYWQEVSSSLAVPVDVYVASAAGHGVGKGNYLRDHPTATDYVEGFACCHPVEVVRGAVTELP